MSRHRVPHRPPVSVVVPFAGTEQELEALVMRLERLHLRDSDELIVADNRLGAAQSRELAPAVRLHPASAVPSPGFARNRGAAAAVNEWLVFIDADTDPDPDLLDAYFRPPPAPATALLAGSIQDVAGPLAPSLVARHAVARGQMSQAVTLGRAVFPYAQSANIAVRRAALVDAGGFEEHARAGEDADLCFRLSERGLGIEVRPLAIVRHQARAGLAAALTQLARHGAGAAWCEKRHPGSFPSESAGQIARRIAHSLIAALRAGIRGDSEPAGFALLEVVETLAFELGRVIPNRPRWRLRP